MSRRWEEVHECAHDLLGPDLPGACLEVQHAAPLGREASRDAAVKRLPSGAEGERFLVIKAEEAEDARAFETRT